MTAMIEAFGLTKTYGAVTALNAVDVEVAEGTVLALLGPNGAGKTTTVSILTTLLRPDGGTARVAGADVLSDAATVRSRIGLSGQYAAVDEHLTGFENLEMIGRLYHLGSKRARVRAGELLDRFDLVAASQRPVKTYSGGMRRRLDLAGSLIAEPPVLFLDEPTTGLDPRSRAELWDVIRDLVKRGRTVLLTTQYMEEAEQLADRVMVIDRGREIAAGTVDELKVDIGGERIDVRVTDDLDVGIARGILDVYASEPATAQGRLITAPVTGGAAALTAVVRALDDHSIPVGDVALRRPTLDEVFLSLTGHETGDGAAVGRSDDLKEVA